MKRFFVAAAAFCLALAALTGCTRHGPDCGVDFCVCGADDADAVRDTESDLVTFDNVPDPVDDGTDAADAEEDEPDVVVPETAEAPETPRAVEEQEEEDFSAEEMARKVRDIEASTKDEPRIIQDIIAEGYDEVPTVVSEAPAVNIEILPAEEAVEEAMAADYAAYLDIEAYDAEEPVAVETPVVEEAAIAETPELPAVVEAIEPVIAETIAEAPEPSAVELPAAAPVQEKEEVGFLLPPPLSITPEPGPAAFAAEVEPDRSEATEELTLEGLDDMDLEFFGSISESLLEAGG